VCSSDLPLLKQNGAFEREAIYWHFPAYLQGYKPGMIWRTTPVAVIRAGDYKLIEFFEDSTLELYNLKEDIGEKHNLADEMPEKKEELYRMMLEWRQETNAPVPIERNPEYKAE
jgi:arylsulfatase A-like enzyme